MTIEPETKSWTWVLERPCEECGFDAQSFPAEEIGSRSRAAAAPWPSFLAHRLVGVRPRPDRWSALEYGCHVRDVYRHGSYRLQLMLSQNDPAFANWDQDESALSDRYDEQDPAVVAAEVLTSAGALADLYETVSGEQWKRRGTRSDGSGFTVDSFGRYFLHDLVHHVVDVEQGYALLES